MTDVGTEQHKTYVGAIGCYNSILGQGISNMLEDDQNFYVMGTFSHFDSFFGICKTNSLDFCILDTFFMKSLLLEENNGYQPECKILLIEDVLLPPKELYSLVLATDVSGMVYKNTDRKSLRKAIFTVLSGEIWFKPETFETLFNETRENFESKMGLKKMLTPSEIKVARLVCQGLKNRGIADKLFISENTVKSHLQNIFRKFDIKSRTELMKICIGKL